MICSATTGLLGVIGDILDLSHIESGKIEASLTEFNLREKIEHLTELFRGSPGSRPAALDAWNTPQ